MEPHEQNRPPTDALQVAAAICVALLIAGELMVLAYIFLSHRSRQMRVHATEVVEVSPPLRANANASSAISTTLPSVAATAPTTATVTPPMVNPAVKIVSAHRNGALLQLRLRAQTGEAEFSATAAAVSVEWHLADGSRQVEWIAVPVAWENFAFQTLAARYDGAMPVRGCVVRTYYRQQLQDQLLEGNAQP